MPGEEIGSSFLGSGEGLLRWRQASWQHLGVKGIQLPRKALAKAEIERQGPGQEAGARTGCGSLLGTGVSVRKGHKARSLE